MTSTINWGDVPTWVAHVGTVGTLTSALWQIRIERQRRLIADEQLRAERRVEQARLVAAYLGEEEQPEAQPETPAQDEGRTEVFLVNNSPEPVSVVVVRIVFVDKPEEKTETVGGRQGVADITRSTRPTDPLPIHSWLRRKLWPLRRLLVTW